MGLQKDFVDLALASSSDECILWPFSKSPGGYGKIKLSYKSRDVHRYVCELAHGEPAKKMCAAHSCGVRLCVNPRHLRWATYKENHDDMIRHGTIDRGEKRYNAKLTEDQVREIRAWDGVEMQKDLAARLGVSRSLVCRVLKGRGWGWLKPTE